MPIKPPHAGGFFHCGLETRGKPLHDLGALPNT